MVNLQCDALSAALARLRCEPRVLTEHQQRRLAAYNAARRLVVAAGCSVINEQSAATGRLEVEADAAGRNFVAEGGCTRRAMLSGVCVYRLIDGVTVMYVEVAK